MVFNLSEKHYNPAKFRNRVRSLSIGEVLDTQNDELDFGSGEILWLARPSPATHEPPNANSQGRT